MLFRMICIHSMCTPWTANQGIDKVDFWAKTTAARALWSSPWNNMDRQEGVSDPGSGWGWAGRVWWRWCRTSSRCSCGSWSCPCPGAGPADAPSQHIASLHHQVQYITHRIRIETEEKAKVAAACLVGRIDSIPCHASYFSPGWYEDLDELHQDDLKNRINSSLSSWCKIAGMKRI